MTWIWPAAGCLLLAIGLVDLMRRRKKFERWAEKRRIELSARETRVSKESDLWEWRWAQLRRALLDIFEHLPAERMQVDHWTNGVRIRTWEPGMRGAADPESLTRFEEAQLIPLLRLSGDIVRLAGRLSCAVKCYYGDQMRTQVLGLPEPWLAQVEDLPIIESMAKAAAMEIVRKLVREQQGLHAGENR